MDNRRNDFTGGAGTSTREIQRAEKKFNELRPAEKKKELSDGWLTGEIKSPWEIVAVVFFTIVMLVATYFFMLLFLKP